MRVTPLPWGLSFSYDGFGNRTNQTVTKGSGPSHSVAIDPATNRISTSGYTYDNNGNMTQMPQLTMSYDVANRMVSSNHASAGTQSYGYNQANQRVFVRNGNTVTYYLYGLGGERLMEFQETCTGGACGGYTETQRWIYFAGRRMFSKTGSTLKAVTPNRLASEAKHFPYGETDGTPPADTKDYFATYRRDGTGLDYAWNRYYSPTMGRFTTADPGPYDYMKPERLNLYVYSGNNPVNLHDPNGRFWKELFGAIAGFFGGGQRDREPALGSGGGNDQAAPDEGTVGAEETGGGDFGGECLADPQTGDLRDADGNVCFSSTTIEIGLPEWILTPNMYVIVDAPFPNAYTQLWVGASVFYFENFETGAWCWGLGPGLGAPANMGVSVGTIVGTASGRPPEEVLPGVGVSLGGTGALIGVPGGGHIFANNFYAPSDGAVGAAVGNEGISYSVSITVCQQP
jgi:RHS repeat-associated protein